MVYPTVKWELKKRCTLPRVGAKKGEVGFILDLIFMRTKDGKTFILHS